MSFRDIAAMAWHNLWSRKLRTFLNVLGVVMACVVLTMMLAGTRGVEESIHRLIEGSDDVRRFGIYRSYKPNTEVPEEALRVEEGTDPERRKRLQEHLRDVWLRTHSQRTQLTEVELKALAELPHMEELRPDGRLSGTLVAGNAKTNASIRIAPLNRAARARLVVGDYLEKGDDEGVLLGEYAAFRLGYTSDEDLRRLIGTEVSVSISLRNARISPLIAMLGIQPLTEASLARFRNAVDASKLQAVERAFLDAVMAKAITTSTNQPKTLTVTMTVRGIVREAKEEDSISIFNLIRDPSGADIFMTNARATELEMQQEGFTSFYAAIGMVDDVRHLGTLVDEVAALGFRTRSSRATVDKVDTELGKVRLALGGLSLLILCVSALGISNTMVVSVLERVREFGVLKALGAQDGSVLVLMLLEGAFTGLVGALVGIATSLGVSHFTSALAQQYISDRLRHDFDASVFRFAPADLLLVITIAVGVCTVAAILPAWRAARLDPIAAMRG